MRARTWIAIVAIVAIAAACGDDAKVSTPPASSPSSGWIGADDDLDWSSESTSESSGGSSTADLAPSADAALASEREEAPPADVGLSAGWVDDNDRWDDYLRYRAEFEALGLPFDEFPVEGRRIITVVDATGRPVLGARVVVTDAAGDVVHDGVTHADGRTFFFPEPGQDQQQSPRWSARVEKGDERTDATLPSGELTYEITLDAPSEAPLELDVLFLIDATGSMSDEIERLKANMISVAEQIAALPAAPDLRVAMTVYRDHGDLFVTRTYDFTADVAAFTQALSEVVADGGGDVPEALDEAFAEAVELPSWRGGDTVSLIFLLADAPPHLGDDAGADATGPGYTTTLTAAIAAGLKVFPIASSGSDPQAEYVFRQLAQATGAPMVFLTYGADGASPGDLTDLNVDDYSVLPLDALVVQLIADELAPQL